MTRLAVHRKELSRNHHLADVEPKPKPRRPSSLAQWASPCCSQCKKACTDWVYRSPNRSRKGWAVECGAGQTRIRLCSVRFVLLGTPKDVYSRVVGDS